MALIAFSAFLALYARELDLMTAASNFLLCYAIFLMICRAFTGNICDKKGPKYVVYPCLLAFTIGLVVLGAVVRANRRSGKPPCWHAVSALAALTAR